MTRFDVARTQQPKSTAAYGSLRFGPLRYQLKRTIGMLPTPDNSECSRQHSVRWLSRCAAVWRMRAFRSLKSPQLRSRWMNRPALPLMPNKRRSRPRRPCAVLGGQDQVPGARPPKR
ncbi:hypothetical protein [Tateyamaria sp.]|uniref:hypothetical protein n=1 Tax=Tateyamaria sp. TaxID=1929288 RepID=UPI003B224D0A